MTAAEHGVDLKQVQAELGQFGRYQMRILALMMFPVMLSAVYNGQYVFAAANVPFRCTVPECESPPLEYEAGAWGPYALSSESCRRMEPLNTTTEQCAPEHFHDTRTVECDGFVFLNNNSMVGEFGLQCAEWKVAMVGTAHSVGLLFALPLTAFISDVYGRRTAFLLTAVSPGVTGLVRSFSSSYYMYIVLEFLDAMLGSGVYSTAFILAMELVGEKWRVVGGNIMSSSFALGQVLLATAAWALPAWRALTRLLYLPSLLCLLYCCCVPESIMWLLAKGRTEDASKIIYRAAELNNKKLSPETIKSLSTVPEPQKKPADSECASEQSPSLFYQVIRSKILMCRLALCSFVWISVTFTYYGLSINSVSLAGNQYVNYMLTSLVEIPGYFLSFITLDQFGRKRPVSVAFLVCGGSLLALPFVPKEVVWASTTLSMLGKLCISMTFSSIYIMTSELFPTGARHSLLGFCSSVGRVGSIVAPATPLLQRYMFYLPYLLFGAMSLVSGCLVTLTPETLHRQMPDTVLQAESMSRTRQREPATHPPPPRPPSDSYKSSSETA